MNRVGVVGCLFATLASAFAAALETPAVEPAVVTTPLRGGVHLLVGRGGNVAVYAADGATLMVDDQYAPRSKLLQEAIAKITPEAVQLVINTHFHFDHTGGNENFGAAGAAFLAHDNARRRLVTGERIELFKIDQPPTAKVGLPNRTFSSATTLYVGDEVVEVVHPPLGAHTDGDAIVFFRKANVVHTGDIFVRYGWPFIDTVHGGSVDGTVQACEWLLGRIDDATQIIPGHGALAKKADLAEYTNKVRAARDAIAKLKSAGKSVDEIVAANPLKDIDLKEGNVTREIFVRLALEK